VTTFPTFCFEWLVRVKVSQYAVALIVAPGGMKSTRRMPFLSQKMDAMIFFTEIKVMNFLVSGGESGVW